MQVTTWLWLVQLTVLANVAWSMRTSVHFADVLSHQETDWETQPTSSRHKVLPKAASNQGRKNDLPAPAEMPALPKSSNDEVELRRPSPEGMAAVVGVLFHKATGILWEGGPGAWFGITLFMCTLWQWQSVCACCSNWTWASENGAKVWTPPGAPTKKMIDFLVRPQEDSKSDSPPNSSGNPLRLHPPSPAPLLCQRESPCHQGTSAEPADTPANAKCSDAAGAEETGPVAWATQIKQSKWTADRWDGTVYYPFLLPAFLFMCFCATVIPAYYLLAWWPAMIQRLEELDMWCVWILFALALIVSPLSYCLTWYQLQGFDSASTLSAEPLQHVVLVIASEEAERSLEGSAFESITMQHGVALRPIVVLVDSSEAGVARKGKVASSLCKETHHRFIFLELPCAESHGPMQFDAKVPWALQQVYSTLVAGEGLDPWKVMVTVITDRTTMAFNYLKQVEAAHWSQATEPHKIYIGLSVCRGELQEASLFQRAWWLSRSHDILFQTGPDRTPRSNFSMTLGYAMEAESWLPDEAVEELRITLKTSLQTCGTHAVVIPAVLCDGVQPGAERRSPQSEEDLVTSMEKRVIVEDFSQVCWILAAFSPTEVNPLRWLRLLVVECNRCGSLTCMACCMGRMSAKAMALALIIYQWQEMSGKLKFMGLLAALLWKWQWMWFWLAEFWLSWQCGKFGLPGLSLKSMSSASCLMLVAVMPWLNSTSFGLLDLVRAVRGVVHSKAAIQDD
mmetsp:Transcript_52956/g.126398  ORF Transcript_52956/g.126398 Transcript_52956/m.126398 type:complete len:736 (-) Transcript_52956:183-2390(-)